MGAVFTNYHVRKGRKKKDAFISKLSRFICKSFGCSLCESNESDSFLTVYFPEKGEWISFISDLLEPKDILPELSEAFGTDVLCAYCNDSDFVTLVLANKKKDYYALARSGRFEGFEEFGLKPTTDFSGWENVVNDIGKFKADVAKERVFAEDFLNTLEGTMKLPPEQARLADYTVRGLDESRVTRLYFNTSGASEEPPRFVMQSFSLKPCEFDSPTNVVCAYNDGRASKGIEIFFTGDHVENDEITFKNVTLERHPKGEWESIPVELKKIRLKDGKYAYHWQDENFKIPAAPSRDLPSMKLYKERYDRELLVRFTPQGNKRKVLDITVWLMPLENSDGGCCWYVWKREGSKRKYIEKHNKDAEEWLAELPEEIRKRQRDKLGLYDPDDLDLD